MSSFIQRTKQLVIGKTLLRSDQTLQEFSILDAWSTLISMAKRNRNVVGCLLRIEREGDHYLIRMVGFTHRGEPVYQNGDMVLGRVLIAYNLADDVRDALDRDGDMTLRLEQLMVTRAVDDEGEDD